MKTALLAALLFAPSLARAQAATSMRAPNQVDPQVQANERRQPPNAHRVEQGPGLGQANAIPTPTLNTPMTKVPNPPGVPHSDPIR